MHSILIAILIKVLNQKNTNLTLFYLSIILILFLVIIIIVIKLISILIIIKLILIKTIIKLISIVIIILLINNQLLKTYKITHHQSIISKINQILSDPILLLIIFQTYKLLHHPITQTSPSKNKLYQKTYSPKQIQTLRINNIN